MSNPPSIPDLGGGEILGPRFAQGSLALMTFFMEGFLRVTSFFLRGSLVLARRHWELNSFIGGLRSLMNPGSFSPSSSFQKPSTGMLLISAGTCGTWRGVTSFVLFAPLRRRSFPRNQSSLRKRYVKSGPAVCLSIVCPIFTR